MNFIEKAIEEYEYTSIRCPKATEKKNVFIFHYINPIG